MRAADNSFAKPLGIIRLTVTPLKPSVAAKCFCL